MEKTEVLVANNTQSVLNSLTEKTLEEDQKMEEDLDFFLDNNASHKKKKYMMEKTKPYSTTRIKARNFLTNISYNGVKEEYLLDRNFVFGMYTLTTKKHQSLFFGETNLRLEKQRNDSDVLGRV